MPGHDITLIDMKTAGIIGGMGPGTTADFYTDINRMSVEQGRPKRPSLLIHNVPLNYEVEDTMLRTQVGLEMYVPLLIESAQRLERGGADFLVVPCNTVHELYDEFAGSVDIPTLHIIDETSERLSANSIGNVALLATGQTINSLMYQDSLEGLGINFTVPNPEIQARLDKIVAGFVGFESANGAVEGGQSDSEWIHNLVLDYVDNIGAVVLGCTDFHALVADVVDGTTVVDSMHTLAEATVKKIYS